MCIDRQEIPIAALVEASRRPEVIEAMKAFYAETDRLIAKQTATCWNKGNCCRFGEFHHRLYVTGLEVCYYLAIGDPPPPVTADVCPHAYAGRCHARDRRPLGCRVFYCDPLAQGWQGPLTEERLARLRTLHKELHVPYVYAEWLTMLRAFGEYRS